MLEGYVENSEKKYQQSVTREGKQDFLKHL